MGGEQMTNWLKPISNYLGRRGTRKTDRGIEWSQQAYEGIFGELR